MNVYTTIKTSDVNIETNEVTVITESTKIVDITSAIDAYSAAVASGYSGSRTKFYSDLASSDSRAINISLDPSSIGNDTITATNVQEAFEQQETKSINGGYF